jgi:hypothetical protein
MNAVVDDPVALDIRMKTVADDPFDLDIRIFQPLATSPSVLPKNNSGESVSCEVSCFGTCATCVNTCGRTCYSCNNTCEICLI